MTPTIYISLDQALQTYENTIRISGGGSAGSLNLGRLESVLENIQNDDWYPTFEEKLTHLFFASVVFTVLRTVINVWRLRFRYNFCCSTVI